MTTHELARKLLEMEDVIVIVENAMQDDYVNVEPQYFECLEMYRQDYLGEKEYVKHKHKGYQEGPFKVVKIT